MCTRMRDHIIDLRLADFSNIKDSDGKTIDVSGHRSALTNALGDSFINECAEKMTASELKCQLEARSDSSASDCLGKSGK